MASRSGYLTSLCLHLLIAVALIFWPVSSPRPLLDTLPSVTLVGLRTLSPGPPSTAIPSPPAGPSTGAAQQQPQSAETPPQPVQAPADPKPTITQADPKPTATSIPTPPKPPKETPPKQDPPKPTTPPKPDPPKPDPSKTTATKPPEVKPEPKPKPKQDPPKTTTPKTKGNPNALSDALAGLAGTTSTGTPNTGSVQTALDELNGTQGGGGTGSATGRAGILGTYAEVVASAIQPQWLSSPRADRENPTAIVLITIGPDGTIQDQAIERSSNNSAFDQSILRAIQDTAQVEAPPRPELQQMRITFSYDAMAAR